jgi:N-glycosylase/DNA lyase
MESGAIPLTAIPGPMDLQATLESGQTFLWERIDGKTYATPAPGGGSAWYRTVHDGEVIEVRETAEALEWRSSTDAVPILRDRLRLADDLDSIVQDFPADDVVQDAVGRFAGMRLVREPFLGTLLSFILSAQMRVERIHEMVTAIRTSYGEPIDWDGEAVYGLPDAEVLARPSEAAYRDLGVGYRAPYIKETAEMLSEEAVSVPEISGAEYEDARDRLTAFVGVGPKVADCVLLFSLDFDEPVPLDTWIQTAIADYFPEANQDSYAETSRAIRDRFGPRPGYTQTYVFHHLRTAEQATPDASD